MIIIGGIQYVSTDSWNGKDLGKKRIQAALGGLILALSSFLILNSIDPSLTYLNFAKGLQPVTTSGGADLIPTLGGAGDNAPVTYDIDDSIGLDPTGETGGLVSGDLETNVDADSCEGLSSYRAAGNFTAMDKGKNSGAVVGEIAWLMKVVPQKFPGLVVMSSYRSLEWNLESAYGVKDEARRKQIIDELAASPDKSNAARAAIASKYGLKRAALTSNHVLGRAVDFAGPALLTGQGDALAAWARNNPCIKFSEVLWGKEVNHGDHVHLGV
jgi:hypothetical protein